MTHPAHLVIARGLELGWGDDLILAVAAPLLAHADTCKEQS